MLTDALFKLRGSTVLERIKLLSSRHAVVRRVSMKRIQNIRIGEGMKW